NSYAQQGGQRDDGSYFLAISPQFSDANKELERKVRIRPSQQGCPDAEWTESEGVTFGDPLSGTSWSADIPGALFNQQLNLNRVGVDPIPPEPLSFDDVSLAVDFGEKGAFSETLTVSISTAKGVPYDGCTVSLTFEGSYELVLRDQYGGQM